jgi:hypothetical protein
MNFMLNLTPQERDVLAELIRLDNEYEALPQDKRAKFILSTDMRKEIRELLNMEEKQFNVILSRLKSDKKSFMGKPLIDENNIIHPELKFKPDDQGFRFEVNFVMTQVVPKPTTSEPSFTETLNEQIVEEQGQRVEDFVFGGEPTPPTEYKYDASQAPVIEEEDWDISISLPND